jgi:DNA/RNA endonuclease YhcR with UshA esterase domain
MKAASFAAAATLWVLSLGLSRAQQPVPVTEAGQHVGQEVAARGTVENVQLQEDGNVRISFTETNQPNGFSVLIVKGTGLDADPRLTFLPGHQLEVRGKVELEGDRPEIKVTSRDQLVKPAGE